MINFIEEHAQRLQGVGIGLYAAGILHLYPHQHLLTSSIEFLLGIIIFLIGLGYDKRLESYDTHKILCMFFYFLTVPLAVGGVKGFLAGDFVSMGLSIIAIFIIIVYILKTPLCSSKIKN